VQGDAAHDAGVSGNPILNGAEARQGDPTAVASGDAVRLIADLLGKLIVLPYANAQRSHTAATTHTATTGSQTLRGAQGSGIRNYITSVGISNTSATGTFVTISDGTTSFIVGAPANFAWCYVLPVPYRAAANTAVTAATNASVSSVYVTASMFDAAN